MKTALKNLSVDTASGGAGTESVTLEFDSARALQSLHAFDDSLLREMESTLAIRITSRDGWLKMEGAHASLERAKKTFQQLQKVASSGGLTGREEFLFALGKSAGDPSLQSGGLFGQRIQCSARKPPVIPKNESQRDYLRIIDSHAVTFGMGPAGTGKTYLAVAKAVAALKAQKVSRIVLTRPAVEAGEALGFLPGELEEKILPYLRPLYDALHDMLEPEEIRSAIDKNIIEIAPLAYMRGRTLNNAFIILDEAQNTTTEQMFMFLTRIGISSTAVITGDITQVDLPRSKPSGLFEALEALSGTKGIAFHRFGEGDVVRHPLVRSIIAAYREFRGHGQTAGVAESIAPETKARS